MKVLLTGDSIIARHEGLIQPRLNFELKKLIPEIKIVNTAISGINSGAFFAMLSQTVFRIEKCDEIVILLGTNDLAIHKQVPLNQFKQNMELIASAIIYKYYPPHVFLVSPPAVDEQKQHVRSNELVKKYSATVEKVATEYGFHYVNLYQAMLKSGQLTEICHGSKNDGLHFGVKGYKLLAKVLRDNLMKNQADYN